MARRNQRFAGKVVLITGAGGGLGSVQARMFAEQGAAVILADVSPVRGKSAASAIGKAGGSALFAELDVTSATSWTRVISASDDSTASFTCWSTLRASSAARAYGR